MEPHLHRLDIPRFAARNGQIQRSSALSDFARLAAELPPGADPQTITVHWQIAAELRRNDAGQTSPWLHCQAEVTLPLACQRCLESVPTSVRTDQWFRFVATEAQAEIEDEEAEEDVLALEQPLDVLTLLEDDLLMALPTQVAHPQCAHPAAPAQPEAPTRRPFAQLAQLLSQPIGQGGTRQGPSGGEAAD